MHRFLFLAQAGAAEAPKPQIVGVEQSLAHAKEWVANNGLTFARNLIVALLIVFIGRIIANAVHKLLIRLLGHRRVDETASRFVANIASVTIMVLVIIT